MIYFEEWGVNDRLLSTVELDRDSKTMTIDVTEWDAGIVQDETTWNIDGWTGRYGKPLEFLLSLHLATMAPDLTYDLAVDEDFDTIVHIEMLKVKLKIDTTITDLNGMEHTLEDLKNYADNDPDFGPAFFPPKGYDADGNPIYYTYEEIYNDLKAANDEEFWTYLPYITWVEKHWFRDVYFDVDAEDIKIYTNNTDGESTSSIEVVDKELKEDNEYWDIYENDEVKTHTVDGVHVYNLTDDDVDYEDYEDYDTYKNAILNGKSSLLTFDSNGLVDVQITGRKIVQVSDAERGATNKAIKDLFEKEYYIYDGTEITAEKIAKGNAKKRPISINRDALAAFTILENTHTLDADYIYKDLKELLVELKYFEQEEMIGDNIKVLRWPIPEYNQETGYEQWPDREVDKPVYDYGTYITSKANYGEKPQASIDNTKIATLEFVEGIETLKIADTETEEQPSSESSKIKNTGYESGKAVISPANGKIESVTGGVKITIEDATTYTKQKSDGSIQNICNGYQIIIKNFSPSKTSGTVQAGEKIGTTTSENIQLIFMDEQKAIVENIEDYIILPGEEYVPKETPGRNAGQDDFDVADDNNSDDNNGNNGNGSGNNNGNNGGNGSGNNNGNGSGNGESVNGSISASVNGYRTKEDIMYAVRNTSGWSEKMIANVESMMDGLLRLQNDFNIDPLVAIALFKGESGVGTAYESRGEYRLDNHQHWENSRGKCKCSYHQYQGFACYNNYSDNAYDWGNYVANRFSTPITTWSGLANTDGMTIYENCNVDDGGHAISFYNKLVETLNNR